MTFAETVKAWRLRECLSQREAGERVGVNHATVSQWETGKARPQFAKRRRLAAAMGVKPSELPEE